MFGSDETQYIQPLRGPYKNLVILRLLKIIKTLGMSGKDCDPMFLYAILEGKNSGEALEYNPHYTSGTILYYNPQTFLVIKTEYDMSHIMGIMGEIK